MEKYTPRVREYLVYRRAQVGIFIVAETVIGKINGSGTKDGTRRDAIAIELEISNNRAERSIKPFVIDRKNFMFANTPRGASASAVMFSIIETAKENGLNPYDYLAYVFEKAPNLDIQNNPEAMNLLLPFFAKQYIHPDNPSCAV